MSIMVVRRVRGESHYNVEDRNDNFGHHRQGRPTGRTGPKTPDVRLPEFDGSVDWSEFDLHFNKVARHFQWNDDDSLHWLSLFFEERLLCFVSHYLKTHNPTTIV